MIFPKTCKSVGYAGKKPVGNMVYCLSEYLIHEMSDGFEILEITKKPGTGMMRETESVKVIAVSNDVYMYPGHVVLHNRADLIRRAAETGKRCTVFTGLEEHMTFVCDPCLSELLTIHVFDVTPPVAHLAETLKTLDRTGIFGELEINFLYHIRDIRETGAEVFPCKAGGFAKTIDSDSLSGNETVAGCMTARQVLAECYGEDFSIVDICPTNSVTDGPFIARCCRIERSGLQNINGKQGYVVHWGSSPREIYDAVIELCNSLK